MEGKERRKCATDEPAPDWKIYGGAYAGARGSHWRGPVLSRRELASPNQQPASAPVLCGPSDADLQGHLPPLLSAPGRHSPRCELCHNHIAHPAASSSPAMLTPPPPGPRNSLFTSETLGHTSQQVPHNATEKGRLLHSKAKVPMGCSQHLSQPRCSPTTPHRPMSSAELRQSSSIPAARLSRAPLLPSLPIAPVASLSAWNAIFLPFTSPLIPQGQAQTLPLHRVFPDPLAGHHLSLLIALCLAFHVAHTPYFCAGLMLTCAGKFCSHWLDLKPGSASPATILAKSLDPPMSPL